MLAIKHDSICTKNVNLSEWEKAVLRRKMYERIAQGNALMDAEAKAEQHRLKL